MEVVLTGKSRSPESSARHSKLASDSENLIEDQKEKKLVGLQFETVFALTMDHHTPAKRLPTSKVATFLALCVISAFIFGYILGDFYFSDTCCLQ
ncbi:unnamed protein product [Caenorhabditis nigoni]